MAPGSVGRGGQFVRAKWVILGLAWPFLASVLPTVGAPAASSPTARDGDREAFFERNVRPVLARYCVACHGPAVRQRGLRLDEGAFARDRRYIVPGDALASPLIRAIMRDGPTPMPPVGALPTTAVSALTRWVNEGAVWPAKSDRPASSGPHWAFRPVHRPTPPAVTDVEWSRNPIDRFLRAAMTRGGVQPLGIADRQTLLRRLTFDLIGLPPTPAELDTFLADSSPNAYRRQVDRLLASRHYGERWGRHWLDVVRYADTAGETADFPVPQAWRYRNSVIDAFNADKPYDRFVREQLAGDILATRETDEARYAEAVTATGYLAVARRFGFDSAADHYLTLEDTIDTFGKSVLGLTLGCARCHDHKYDPVSTRDYYGLYGIFDSTRFPFPGCEKEKQPRDMVPLLPESRIEARTRAERAQLEGALAQGQSGLKAAGDRVRDLLAVPASVVVRGEFADGGQQRFDAGTGGDQLGSLTVRAGEFLQLSVLPRSNHGADSTLVDWSITEIGGQGRSWNPTRDIAGPRGRRPSMSSFPDEAGTADVWLAYDLVPEPALFTRFTERNLDTPGLSAWRGAGQEPLLFLNTLNQAIPFFGRTMPARGVGIHPGPRGGVALTWRSPISGTVRVSGQLSDLHPGGGDGIAWVLERRPGFQAELPVLTDLAERTADLRDRLQALMDGKWVDTAYAVREGVPHNVRIHDRGDPALPREEVPRKNLDLLGGDLVPNAAGSGRELLAQWVTRPDNPLTARVMVNRIWQGHFGRGLVATPNDFGTRGQPPTHPALLDWLADEFIRSGWSVKAMHRLIVTSRAYRTASSGAGPNGGSDRQRELYGCFHRRRLDAEEIRDALLAVSGDLDRTPGGAHPFPPAQQWSFTQHGPFLAVYDTNRRSVYLMTQRIRRHPFLGLFDGADPSSSTGGRMMTTVPTQALYFMNDPFVHACSRSLAARVAREPRTREAAISGVYRLLYSRLPTPIEVQESIRFLREYGAASPGAEESAAWAAWLRVLFAGNEFLYVD